MIYVHCWNTEWYVVLYIAITPIEQEAIILMTIRREPCIYAKNPTDIIFIASRLHEERSFMCFILKKLCYSYAFHGVIFCYIAPLHTLYWSALKGSCVLLRDDRVVLQHMFIVAVNTMGSHRIGAIMDDIPNIVCGKSTAQHSQWY